VVVQDLSDKTKVEAMTPISTLSRTPVDQTPALVMPHANENPTGSKISCTPRSLGGVNAHDSSGVTNSNMPESIKSFAQSIMSFVSPTQWTDWTEECSPMRSPLFQITPLPSLTINMKSPPKMKLNMMSPLKLIPNMML